MEEEKSQVYTSAVLGGPICAILGLDPAAVGKRAGLKIWDAPDHRLQISAEEFVRLWDAMMEMANLPDIAATLGRRVAAGPAIPVLFAMSTAPNFETGMARLARYKHLFGPMRYGVARTADTYTIRVLADSTDISLPGSFTSAQIVYLHAKASAMTTRPFGPIAVSLPLAEIERAALRELFGRVPDDGPPMLRYRSADVRTPFVSPNEALWDATERDLESQSVIMLRSASFSHRVKAALLEAFATTDPSLNYVCARLQTSKSTLLRRLKAERTTFQELRDIARTDLAERYLRTSDLNNQQIAHLLGYRDTSAFQRAFRKWTGKTPRELRMAMTGHA
ncbi:MAG: AraC family transcriptional regulator ligand-binding domain-containing protein [Pseudomonadota bacterium]